MAMSHLYEQVFDQLLGDIEEGRYKPGEKLPSEAALVKRFAASRITVGRAVRELQQRGLVDRIAGSGTYIAGPHRTATSTGLLFGLIIPNLGETEIFEPICRGIAASPDADGHALLWAHADPDTASKEEQALQLCRQSIARGVDGVFFAPLELSDQSVAINRRIMQLLSDARIPVVLLDRRSEDPAAKGNPHSRCDLVGIDNHRAGFLATQHLLGLGASRIGFLAYENQATTIRDRIRGYTDALQFSGRVFYVPNLQPLQLPQTALTMDAFVCGNDRLAGYLMQTLLARNLRIPQDVRIVGIDDVNYASLLPVPLTTVHQPCRDIGETALRVMLERLSHPKAPARDVLLDCSLVIRESCGARLKSGLPN